MQPISGYLYKQIITIVKNSNFAPYRENQLFYAKPLQIYKGVDNKFQFLFKNQDQKPVSLLDSSVLFNLINPTTTELVFSRTLQLVYSDTGIATTLVESSLIDDVNAGLYNYSIVVTSPEGEQQIAYSDDNYNAQGQARIHDNVYPAFVESFKPSILNYTNDISTGYLNIAYTSATQMADRAKGRAVAQTVQYNCAEFTGIIECQATQDYLSVSNAATWVVIQDVTLTNMTGNGYFNFYGKFNAVRFKITKTSGDVNYIQYRP